ncbi:hypothetical protein V6N12_016115 [Hibiscus sabdariffa]|uniref:Uncharacterized protein n=1 Tax=Hibiscus sabdariffa TaxID=183260 RepID=A0ABR2C8S1_9ROSI
MASSSTTAPATPEWQRLEYARVCVETCFAVDKSGTGDKQPAKVWKPKVKVSSVQQETLQATVAEKAPGSDVATNLHFEPIQTKVLVHKGGVIHSFDFSNRHLTSHSKYFLCMLK